MVTVSELVSADELSSLEGEWADLATRCPQATPFQHPGWVLPWQEHFGSGDLFVLAVRSGGMLRALLPLFLHEWSGRRQLTMLGTGISDYLDVLVEPEMAAESVAALLAYVAECRGRWDVCSWQDLPEGSPLLCGTPAEFAPVVTDAERCVALTLPETRSAFLLSLPHGLQRNIRRYTDRLTTLGELRFETQSGDEEHGTAMDDLFVLHGNRWSDRGEQGVLHDARVQSFHRAAARNLSRIGALRLYRVSLDGRPIAVVYGYAWRGTFYSYLGGFASDLKACSPGTVILAYAMQQALEEGVRVWDFLRGEETYKFTWGGVAIPKCNLLLHSKC